jgi:hypothetical protein
MKPKASIVGKMRPFYNYIIQSSFKAKLLYDTARLTSHTSAIKILLKDRYHVEEEWNLVSREQRWAEVTFLCAN